MKEDLIFHLVPRRKWKEWQNKGSFAPPVLSESGGQIECLRAGQVQYSVNKQFPGRKHILLLVINTSQLRPSVHYVDRDGESIPCLDGPLNLDAVIDKITLEPDEDGRFELDIIQQ